MNHKKQYSGRLRRILSVPVRAFGIFRFNDKYINFIILKCRNDLKGKSQIHAPF